MKRSFKLLPEADLGMLGELGELVAFNVGPEGESYFVFADGELDYWRASRGGGTFAKTIPDRPQDYQVVTMVGGAVRHEVSVRKEQFNVHDVQPLSQHEFILACCRSHYRSPDDFERNGRVYRADGTFARELLLGDGIKSLQSTSDGVLWTSYSDEGIFGNFGWDDPVGTAGLVAWDSSGKKLYEYQPASGLDSICDCYSLNVASDNETWCYYYTEFPLVRVRNHKIDGFWKVPIGGSDAFAIADDLALFRGGYKHHDDYQLLTVPVSGLATKVADIQLHDERGNRLTADRVVGRGDSLYLLSGQLLYRVDVATVA